MTARSARLVSVLGIYRGLAIPRSAPSNENATRFLSALLRRLPLEIFVTSRDVSDRKLEFRPGRTILIGGNVEYLSSLRTIFHSHRDTNEQLDRCKRELRNRVSISPREGRDYKRLASWSSHLPSFPLRSIRRQRAPLASSGESTAGKSFDVVYRATTQVKT